MNSVSNFIANIRKLIAEDKLEEAFQELQKSFAGSQLSDKIIQESARFQRVQKESQQGVIRREEEELILNQIRVGLLDWLKEIKEHDTGQSWKEFVDVLEQNLKVKQQADQPYHFNLALTKAIINGMAQYHDKANKLKTTKGWDTQSENLKKVQAFLCRSFVGEIGKQLRQLIAIGNETEMSEEKKQSSYVCKCLDIAKRSLDLVNFALLSELWNVFQIAPRNLTDRQKEKLRHRFDHTLEFSVAEQFELLGTLAEIFKEHELKLPLEELKNLQNELKIGSALHHICQAFDALHLRGLTSFSSVDCANAETQLSHFFQHFSFLVNYKMASIKRIGYRQDRNTDPRYLHRYIALGIDQKATEDAEKVNFTDLGEATYAVLLYRGDHYQGAKNISLFPFVIDYNSLTFEKGAKVCFFSSKDFADDILEYRFLTDNSLIKIEKKNILRNITNINDLKLEDKNLTILNLDMVADGLRDARKTLLGTEKEVKAEFDFDNL